MAKSVKSYRVDTKNKVIIIYSNIKKSKNDDLVIGTYINNGFKVKAEEKITVEMMKKELKKADEKLYNEFIELYNSNEDGAALGFHRACQFYTKWKKENKKAKKQDKE